MTFRFFRNLGIVSSFVVFALQQHGYADSFSVTKTPALADSVLNSDLSYVIKMASSGDASAQYLLGLLYVTGSSLPKNSDKGILWFRRAAEQGNADAQNGLAIMIDPRWVGTDDEKGLSEAIEWYERAASQGHESATYNLSDLKQSGHVSVTSGKTSPLIEHATLKPKPVEFQLMGSRASEVFSRVAPSVVEVIGDDSYGSGVIIGLYENLPKEKEGFSLNEEFVSRKLLFSSLSKGSELSLSGNHLLVVTNLHVLKGNKALQLGLGSDADGKTERIFPVSGLCVPAGESVDLALLFTPLLYPQVNHGFSALKLQNTEFHFRIGSTVYAVGNPERFARTITQGLYNGYREEGLQFSASISHGSSGGALVDENSNLVGITTGFSQEETSQNLNFALGSSEIFKLLRSSELKCFSP